MKIEDAIRAYLGGDRSVAVPWRVNARGCWIWKGARQGKDAKRGRGYGCLCAAGRTRIAHRFIWEIKNGRLLKPTEQFLHACDDSLCVNPEHGRPGSNAENAAEKAERFLAASRLTADDVRTIRARVAAGELQRVVATDFGLHQADVSNIAHRKYWKHL